MCSHNKRRDEVAEVREKAEGLCFSRYAGKRLDGEEGGRRLGRSRVADARLLATNGRGAAQAMPVLDVTVARVALSGQNSDEERGCWKLVLHVSQRLGPSKPFRDESS